MDLSFKSTKVKIFFTIWIVYIFFLSGYGGNWLADSMLAASVALVEDHTFVTDEYVKGYQDNAFYKGHYYSGFAPGATLIAVPLLFVIKPIFMMVPETFMGYPQNQIKVIIANIAATVFITSLLSALLSVLLYDLLKHFIKKEKYRLFIVFSFAFGTIFFFQSTEYNSRVMATFFSFYSFYLLFNAKRAQAKVKYLFFAGFLGGLAVFIEYTQVIALAFLVVYLLTFVRNRTIFYFFLGGAIPLVAFLSYNYYIFDGPFEISYKYKQPFPTSDEKNFFDVSSGFFGAKSLSIAAIFGLTFSPEKGFFFYMPLSFLFIFGLFFVLKNRKNEYFTESLLISLLFFGLLLYNAALPSWRANCGFGPRYLSAAIPFLMTLAAFALDKIRFKIAAFLVGISVFINTLGAFYSETAIWTGGCYSSSPITKYYIPLLFQRGITNYTLNLIKERIYDLSVFAVNMIAIVGLIFLGLIIYFLWKK